MKLSKKTKKSFTIYCALVLMLTFVTPAYAANDPLQVVNNLSDFIFGLIRAIGMILLGFGIVQITAVASGTSATQRRIDTASMCSTVRVRPPMPSR